MSAIDRVPRNEVRASDGDREDTAARLRRAYADGCLTTEEFEQRLDRVFEARTRGDLKRLLADLPKKNKPTRERIELAQRKAFRDHAYTFTAVNGGLVTIWAATGADAHFWPIWSIVPWGVMLLWHRSASRAISKRIGRGG